jgi:hypothetical protein
MKGRMVMQDAQNTAISNEYRSVPLRKLVESVCDDWLARKTQVK